MARRRSLNRRWSRRSLNGTGILNDDSNIVDDEDPLWWKKIGNNPNSIRPSGRFTMGESSSTAELHPNSTFNDTEASGEWWDVLQKTSQDLVPKKIDKNDSKTTSEKIIIRNTSDSDTDDRLHDTKKRKINFRRTRKSLGIDAFSQALDSSEPAIESEPALSQNSRATRTSFQSLDELPPRKTRQQSKNDSISSHNSHSSDTEKIRKKRPVFFKKPRARMSRTAIDDVLEADESVIAPSQEVDIEKPSSINSATSKRSSERSCSTILKPMNDQTSLAHNKSLNQGAENESLELKSKSDTNQSVLPRPVKHSREQSQVSGSDNESQEVISQPRTYFKKNNRKKSSTNPFDDILVDSDEEDREISSKEKSTKQTASPPSILNENSGNDENNVLSLYLPPSVRDSTSDSISKSHEVARSNKSIADQSLSKDSKRYESDGSTTTSLSEELKIGNPSQRFISDASPIPGNKMNMSSNAYVSNEFVQDWDSDDSDESGSPDKSDPKNADISEHSALTEKNSDCKSQKHTENKSKNEKSVGNDSNTSQSNDDANTTAKRGDNSNESNKSRPIRKSSRRPSDQSLGKEIAQKSSIRSAENRGRSVKVSDEELEASAREIMTKRPNKKRSRSAHISVEQRDTDNTKITVDRSIENPSQEIETSDEEIITNKPSGNRSQSMKISDIESDASDERIFNRITISDRSTSQIETQAEFEENNNKGLDSPEKSRKTPSRKSRKRPRKTPDTSKISSRYSKVEEKNAEAVDESDSDSEISRDPSAYELPDMNRSDSVTLSDSDNENEPPNDENTVENRTPGRERSLPINRSPDKKASTTKTRTSGKNRSTTKNEHDTSKISTDNISMPLSEPVPSTSGVQKGSPKRKSLMNPSGRKSNKSNVSSNQRSILNYLAPHSPRPVRHEPLPTEDEVNDLREKLKTVAIGRGIQKQLQKEEMEKELEGMRIKLANQKNSNVKKIPKKITFTKNPKNATKSVDKAFMVNGKVYKQPKLPRPKHWATDRLYKYLWKMMEPKFNMETRIRSEKFIIELSNVVTIVMRRKKYENYKDEVDALMKRMARLGIIKTRNDFYHFCYDFLPYEFRAKVTPILLPGNKHTIPFDPAIVDIPLLDG